MTLEELKRYVIIAQCEMKEAGITWGDSELFPIPKSELIVGKTYYGYCRNAIKAFWTGYYFTYERYKFGSIYIEAINHYEDDDGYDVFVPVMKCII